MILTQRTNLADLRVGDRVFIPGSRAAKPIIKVEVERSRITVQLKAGTATVNGATFDRLINTLADAVR